MGRIRNTCGQAYERSVDPRRTIIWLLDTRTATGHTQHSRYRIHNAYGRSFERQIPSYFLCWIFQKNKMFDLFAKCPRISCLSRFSLKNSCSRCGALSPAVSRCLLARLQATAAKGSAGNPELLVLTFALENLHKCNRMVTLNGSIIHAFLSGRNYTKNIYVIHKQYGEKESGCCTRRHIAATNSAWYFELQTQTADKNDAHECANTLKAQMNARIYEAQGDTTTSCSCLPRTPVEPASTLLLCHF